MLATITIFWSAVFAIIFFILGIVIKALSAAINSLMTSVAGLVALSGLAGLVGVALYLVYAIIDGVIKKGIWYTIGMIVLFIIVISILIVIVGGVGSILLELVVVIAAAALNVLSIVLEWLEEFCEDAYDSSLSSIIKCINKC